MIFMIFANGQVCFQKKNVYISLMMTSMVMVIVREVESGRMGGVSGGGIGRI